MGGRTFRPFGRGSVALFDAADARPDAGCFADEVVIDFPSVAPAVDRMRNAFLEDERAASLSAAIRLSAREARDGAMVPRRDLDRAVPAVPGQRHGAAPSSAAGGRPRGRPRRHLLPLHGYSPT
jgi:hypothetical protein